MHAEQIHVSGLGKEKEFISLYNCKWPKQFFDTIFSFSKSLQPFSENRYGNSNSSRIRQQVFPTPLISSRTFTLTSFKYPVNFIHLFFITVQISKIMRLNGVQSHVLFVMYSQTLSRFFIGICGCMTSMEHFHCKYNSQHLIWIKTFHQSYA